MDIVLSSMVFQPDPAARLRARHRGARRHHGTRRAAAVQRARHRSCRAGRGALSWCEPRAAPALALMSRW